MPFGLRWSGTQASSARLGNDFAWEIHKTSLFIGVLHVRRELIRALDLTVIFLSSAMTVYNRLSFAQA
jgi:hypothetical protein